jgi:succinate dehydrogenase / fumarate reductase cytochrome b subunit
VGIPCVSPTFGRQEFLIRRLHSLTGLFPVGAFLVIHLATNASILDGGDTYQARVDQIHAVGPSTLLMVEWIFIFLPILFHALIGILIVARGKRNVIEYPYSGNVRYTLQRWTGVIAFFFIFWHVFQTRGWIQNPWWVEHVTRPLGGGLFDPKQAAISSADAVRSSTIATAGYLIGVLASVYHLFNGVWTAGITWGVWTSPRSQRWALISCAGLGIIFAALSVVTLVEMYNFKGM